MREMTASAFDDPGEFGARLPDVELRVTVTGPGVFRADAMWVACRNLNLILVTEGLSRVAQVLLGTKIAGVAFPVRHTQAARIGGLALAFGEIAILGAGCRFHMATPADFHWCVITFDSGPLPGEIDAALGPEMARASTLAVVAPPHALLRRLLRLQLRAGRTAGSAPERELSETSAAGLEASLAEAVAACLEAARPLRADAARARQMEILNRLELLLQANMHHGIRMPALADELGVSGRWLRACCQRHLGMSLGRYVCLRRLAVARSALSVAGPERRSVRQIAADSGFPQAGRFAVLYRGLFGETPSATLQRAHDKAAGGMAAGGMTAG